MTAVRTTDAFQPTPQRLHWDPVSFRAVTTDPVFLEAHQPLPDKLPDAGEWATNLTRAAVECLHGLRPAHQLARWLAPPVFEALTDRIATAPRENRGAHMVRVRHAIVSDVDDRTREASCTVFDGVRFRACAMRLREHKGRWLVVALEIG